MKKTLLAGLALGLMLLGTVGVASATSVAVGNAGFENGKVLYAPWVKTTGIVGLEGFFKPTAAMIAPNGTLWAASLNAGTVPIVPPAIGNGGIHQTLGETYDGNFDYTLSFFAGSRLDIPPSLPVSFSAELKANGNILAQLNGVIPSNQGTWNPYSLTLSSNMVGDFIGQNIEIWFTNTSQFGELGGYNQLVLDNVSLDKNNPVPEPATMLLFGTGLVGLAGISRRRKK